MKKRYLGLVLSMTVAATVLAGCGSSASDTSSAASTESETASAEAAAAETQTDSTDTGEGQTITITYKDNGEGENQQWYVLFQEAYDNWDKKDQYELNIAPISGAEGDYYTKVALQLSDPSNCPDIVLEDTFQLSSDVAAGYLTNLDDYVKDYAAWNDGTYIEALKAGSSYGGSVYGIPFSTDARGIWYNKEIFKQAGLPEDWQPETWQDILDACETVKQNVSDVIPFWCNSGVATGEATSMQTYEMLLYGTGEQLLEDDKWIVNSQAIEDTLQFLSDIYTNGYGPSLELVLNGQATNTARREYLPQSKVAMVMDGAWIYSNWEEDGAAPWAEYNEVMGLAAMPQQNGGGTVTRSGGWTISIPENSDCKDAAFELIAAAMDSDAYVHSILRDGACATRNDVAALDEYQSNQFRAFATEQLDNAFFRPQNEQYSTVTTCIQTMVETVVSGATPEEAMSQYASDVARVVGDDNVISK